VDTEGNKRVVRRFIEEVVNTGDVSRITEVVSPDYIEPADPTGATRGLEAARRHVLGVREVWADLHVTVERQVAEGEWVASEVTARARHAGPWLGIEPTGRRVEITGVNLDRVVDGRIVEHGGAANLFEALLSIGAIRPVTPRGEGAP